MPDSLRLSPLLRYSIAVLAVGLTLVLQILLIPWFGGDPNATPFIMFFGAVVVAAWFGGWRPGLLATALSALASDYFFLFPQHTLQISSLDQGLRLGVFVLEGLLISALMGMLHSARQRAQESLLRASENERNLREGEQRYQTFIQQSTEGIWRFELERPVPTDLSPEEQIERFYRHAYLAECNYAMARMYGFSRPEEIVGARLGDFLPRSVPENVEYLRAFIRSGYRLTGAESQEVDRHGDTKYFSNNLIGIIEEGSLVRAWGTQRDITERKQDEETRARLAAIVESSDDAIIGKTLDGIITSWNLGAQKIYGYSAEEVLGKPITILVPPERSDEIPQILQSIGQGEAIDHCDTKRIAKDGRSLDVSLTISPIRDSSGNIVGAATVARDVTERKRAEEEVEMQAAQQAAVAELGRRALEDTDLSLLMDEAGALVAQTLRVEYCKILELLPEGDALLLRAGMGWNEGLVGRATVGAGLDSQAGYTLLSDGPVIFEDLRSESRFEGPPLLHEHGVVSGMSTLIRGYEKPFGVLGAHTKNRRSFTEDDVNFLRAVAHVLCIAIERKEAEEALREVKEAERNRLARDLHDGALQALTYALAETQLIQRLSEAPELDGRLERTVQALKRSGRELRAAVYDLRLEEETDKPFPELVESLVELNRGMVPDLDIRLEMADGFPSSPLAGKDRELLRILREALSNARKHSGAQNVDVRLGIEGDELWAEGEDDGRGFDPDTASGVGLKSMRERARTLSGNLMIESEPGKNTKVRFEVTLYREDSENPQSEEEARILLVEDHTSYRDATTFVLEREPGFEVVGQAGSLTEARKMLEGGSLAADVAIVDLGLPDGYGGELIKELREGNSQLQALVLSARLDQSEVAQAVEAGAAGILHKSVGMEEVVEAVRRLRAGETLLPPEQVVELLRFASSHKEQEQESHQAIAQLTPREKEVLQALAEGLDGKQIAERLHISILTERNHMTSILSKLRVHSRLQAVLLALRYGVVEIP